MNDRYYWRCSSDDCRQQVKPPEKDGIHWGQSWCRWCKAWVLPVIVPEISEDQEKEN